MRWGLRAGLAGVLFVFTLGTSQALAQSDRERAAAREAAKEGIAAFQKEDWETSLKYLQRAESVVHAPTHLLFIARANVRLGQFLEAREAYQKLINERLSSSAPQAFHNAQDAGREEIKEIEGRLGKITIEVVGPDGAELEELEVSVSGDVVPAQFVDLPVPANPGEQKVTGTAKGMLPAEATVVVEEGGRASVTLQFSADTGPVAAPVTETPEPEPQKAPQEAAPQTDPSSSTNPQKTIGWITIGTGAAAGIAGAVFWYMGDNSLGKATRDDSLCRAQDCTADGISKIDDAKTQALIGDIAVGVGVLAIGVGAALVATAKKPSQSVGVRSLTPVVGTNGGYLMLEGGF